MNLEEMHMDKGRTWKTPGRMKQDWFGMLKLWGSSSTHCIVMCYSLNPFSWNSQAVLLTFNKIVYSRRSGSDKMTRPAVLGDYGAWRHSNNLKHQETAWHIKWASLLFRHSAVNFINKCSFTKKNPFRKTRLRCWDHLGLTHFSLISIEESENETADHSRVDWNQSGINHRFYLRDLSQFINVRHRNVYDWDRTGFQTDQTEDIVFPSLCRNKVNKDWQLHEGLCESWYHIQSIDSAEIKGSREEWSPTVSFCRQLCSWLSNPDQDAQLALLQSLRNAESGFYWWA